MGTSSEAIAKFSLDFFQVLCKENLFDNIIFSPANLIAGLGLMALGSESDITAQIEKILRWDKLTECKASGRKRYLVPTRSYDRSEGKLRDNVFHRASSTMALFSEDDKHRLGPEAVPHGGPTAPESACPYHKVPNYECEKPGGIHTVIHKILAALNRLSMDYQVDIANRLYADDNIVFIQKFLYCAMKLYLTEVDGVDIQNIPEEVRKLINLWVEVQTHGKIKNLLSKESFDRNAHLVLVNALYFKGQWNLQFDKAFTQEGVFYLNERDSTTVQFMYQIGQYNIGTIEECEVQVIEIPYRNKEMSLFILLPQDTSVNCLQQLQNELTAEKMLGWSCSLKSQEVEVVIPKFSIEKSIHITAYLDLSNMTDSPKADLSQTTTTKDMALMQFTHDTYFEADEEGGEKAKGCHCHKKKHVWNTSHFVADHPFVYYVLHKDTQSIVILGRFSKPEPREVSK